MTLKLDDTIETPPAAPDVDSVGDPGADAVFCDPETIQNDLKDPVADTGMNASEIDADVDSVVLPEIKGLEILKEGAYAIDPEKTITNMVAVVKKMEAQLQNALLLNASLEKDLDDSKEMIIDLSDEKAVLKKTIARLENEIPSKRELQLEIEYLTEERSSAQRKIRDLNKSIDKLEKAALQHQETIVELKTDKKDSRIETDYLITRIGFLMKKNKSLAAEVKKLEQDNLSKIARINMLEKELNSADEERYRIYKERIR